MKKTQDFWVFVTEESNNSRRKQGSKFHSFHARIRAKVFVAYQQLEDTTVRPSDPKHRSVDLERSDIISPHISMSSSYTPVNILVTGGAGFIASHVSKLLVHKYPQYNVRQP